MPKQRIRRTTGDVLVFDGDLLLKLDNRRTATVERRYFHEVAIYRVDAPKNFEVRPGELLHKVTFLCTLNQERPHEWVAFGPLPRLVLEQYAPLEYVQGYPPGEGNVERNRMLRESVAADWSALAMEVQQAWQAKL